MGPMGPIAYTAIRKPRVNGNGCSVDRAEKLYRWVASPILSSNTHLLYTCYNANETGKYIMR